MGARSDGEDSRRYRVLREEAGFGEEVRCVNIWWQSGGFLFDSLQWFGRWDPVSHRWTQVDGRYNSVRGYRSLVVAARNQGGRGQLEFYDARSLQLVHADRGSNIDDVADLVYTDDLVVVTSRQHRGRPTGKMIAYDRHDWRVRWSRPETGRSPGVLLSGDALVVTDDRSVRLVRLADGRPISRLLCNGCDGFVDGTHRLALEPLDDNRLRLWKYLDGRGWEVTATLPLARLRGAAIRDGVVVGVEVSAGSPEFCAVGFDLSGRALWRSFCSPTHVMVALHMAEPEPVLVVANEDRLIVLDPHRGTAEFTVHEVTWGDRPVVLQTSPIVDVLDHRDRCGRVWTPGR